ncbi:MAG: hypothetical protein OXH11_07870 [Candidatus Aminicenantes bacterium]|nr:hypothetical protein [Candidatus Aminicenantes bacterium]
MKTKRFVLFWFAFTAVASAQNPQNPYLKNYYPKKDAAFGQVVVGGGYETVINLTNRGSRPYAGTLGLFRTVNNESVDWNPTVNGVAVENGEYPVRIQPQATVTLRLTGSQVEAGAAILLTEDLSRDNFENLSLENLIEANLSYLVRENGRVSDSVGIAPSKEFYRASIPFEKFKEIALALVNGDLSGERTATVELSLFSGDGDPLGTKEVITLGPLSHLAQFLHEYFPGQALDGGKVEIASDVPIFGTALTFSGGQFSSLPLDPAPVTYSVRLEDDEGYATGELALWAEGLSIRGYMVISGVDGQDFDVPEFSLVNGELKDGFLRLAFTILQDPFFNEPVTMSMGHNQFSFESERVSGKWIEWFQNDQHLKGTYELTR